MRRITLSESIMSVIMVAALAFCAGLFYMNNAPRSGLVSIVEEIPRGNDDDCFYEDTEQMADVTKLPQEKAQILQRYVDKYPSGAHSREIKALLLKNAQQTLTMCIFVKAFTNDSVMVPGHSITYELLINGKMVRSIDSPMTAKAFMNVPVKVGDVLTGRALWKNALGAVQTIDETPKETTHTVVLSDDGCVIHIQTYDGGIYIKENH